MVDPNEYDLYMRPDSNCRGHHQWFYFKVTSNAKMGTVKFNIVNFTKYRSLFSSDGGMQIAILNVKDRQAAIEKAEQDGKAYDPDQIGWVKGGKNPKYGSSKLNNLIAAAQRAKEIADGGDIGVFRGPFFYQLSFEHDFDRAEKDETYFAYHFPHTFTRVTRFLKKLKTRLRQN